MSFAGAAASDAAVQALRERGFPADEIHRYTPEEMRLQTEQDLHNDAQTPSGLEGAGAHEVSGKPQTG